MYLTLSSDDGPPSSSVKRDTFNLVKTFTVTHRNWDVRHIGIPNLKKSTRLFQVSCAQKRCANGDTAPLSMPNLTRHLCCQAFKIFQQQTKMTKKHLSRACFRFSQYDKLHRVKGYRLTFRDPALESNVIIKRTNNEIKTDWSF